MENAKAKEQEVDVIKHLCCVWFLTKALATEVDFLREYMNPEYKKMLSDIKAKSNFFCKNVAAKMEKGDIDKIDDQAAEVLELAWEYTQKTFNNGNNR